MTDQWPRFAAAAFSRIPWGEGEASTEEIAEWTAAVADALDAEWEKRKPLLGFTELPAVKEISAALDADAIRSEERERVLVKVEVWLWERHCNCFAAFYRSRDAGRFDPPEGGK